MIEEVIIMEVGAIIYFLLSSVIIKSICFTMDYDAIVNETFKMENIKKPTARDRRLAMRIAYCKKEAFNIYEKQIKFYKNELNECRNEYTNELNKRRNETMSCALKLQTLEDRVVLYENVLRIIGMRTKVEDLTDLLYPRSFNNKTKHVVYGKPYKMSYNDAIHDIITSNSVLFTSDPFIMMVRGRLKERGIEPADFMKFIGWLYENFGGKACHKMAQFAPDLPKYNDIPAIHKMVEWVKIDIDIPAITCIQVILQPLDNAPVDFTRRVFMTEVMERVATNVTANATTLETPTD